MSKSEIPDCISCCPAIVEAPIDETQAADLARVLKAIADPTRLRLLSLVLAQPDQEACVCDLTEPLGLTQPTVSHHCKVLHDVGLLDREKRGVWVYYRARTESLRALADLIAAPAAR